MFESHNSGRRLTADRPYTIRLYFPPPPGNKDLKRISNSTVPDSGAFLCVVRHNDGRSL